MLARAYPAASAAVLLVLVTAGAASAEVWQHDQYAADPASAVEETNGVSMGAHPGFIAGEGFGQIYTPAPGTYPITIDGFDLIVMGPPEAPGYQAHLDIEIYIDPGTSGTAQPDSTVPDFQISTSDMAASIGGVLNDKGQVKAGTFYSATFDKDDSGGHPPVVTGGHKIWLMVRYTTQADVSVSWDGCANGCGCQSLVVPIDEVITTGVNVMHVTLSGCNTAPDSWLFQEELMELLAPFGQGGPKGDFLMRLRVSTGGAGCSCDGKECGTDGCGNVCGQCPNGFVCVQGSCNTEGGDTGGCDSACDGKSCGSDGCGGVCGVCSGDDVCVQGVCTDTGGGCTSSCDGKDCGDDGCGGQCGLCVGEQVCVQGSCTDPGGGCDTDCSGKDCGDDGCGGLCGVCSSDENCIQGDCQAVDPGCQPSCSGKDCGSDGCGGECGQCGADDFCQAGNCAPTDSGSGDLSIIGVSPKEGYVDEATDIAISGDGFHAGMSARIGTTAMALFGVTGDSLLDAVVPADMDPGVYNIIVISEDKEDTATLTNAFTVLERIICGNGTCDGVETCDTCAIDCGPCEDDSGTPSGGCAATGGLTPLAILLAGLLAAAAAAARRRKPVPVRAPPAEDRPAP